ncbi:hypothetical protein BLA29_011726 [Euroglyphus maynei]|uniref:Uncharacterized protein n=1 Tax=Euroglyphus maynei TaxID=6958 RepID=A0A1Y3ATM0_EURMA|nr:hypothetical protein BLA29_011726 [Euroglyphus maynei]
MTFIRAPGVPNYSASEYVNGFVDEVNGDDIIFEEEFEKRLAWLYDQQESFGKFLDEKNAEFEFYGFDPGALYRKLGPKLRKFQKDVAAVCVLIAKRGTKKENILKRISKTGEASVTAVTNALDLKWQRVTKDTDPLTLTPQRLALLMPEISVMATARAESMPPCHGPLKCRRARPWL